MISTRQLIFVISIVFFFVNGAKSGNINSTKASSKSAGTSRSSAGTSSRNADNEENADEVNEEHLSYCILELTTAFKKHECTFDTLLYAYLNLNTEDFEKKTHSKVAYDYFHDLLNTAHDLIIQPVLENPRNYCENYYGYQVQNCIRSLKELECEADDDGIICVKNLYLKWKKKNMRNLRPVEGTENISDQELDNAFFRVSARFPDLSNDELVRRLSDVKLLEDFYSQNEHRRENIEQLSKICDNYYNIERKLQEDIMSATEDASTSTFTSRFGRRRMSRNRYRHLSEEDRYRHLAEEDRYRHLAEEDRYRHLSEEEVFRRLSIEDSREHARENRRNADMVYLKQRDLDKEEARYECYGISGVGYENLVDEFNRRQKIYKNEYAMYLYNQLELWGQTLPDEEKNKFQDPKSFCTNYLLNHTDHYDFLEFE